MFYVYQITNKLNGKIYVGVHKSERPDDSYMGSGVGIKRAKKSEAKRLQWETKRSIMGTCPHCWKTGVLIGLKRWHFDNCKMRGEQ